MDVWNDCGITSKNSTKHKCFLNAVLLVKANDKILEKKFKYENVSNDTYEETSAVGSFSTKSKVIYSNFYWLNWCNGARVRLESGEEYTIKSVDFDIDNTKAFGNGNGVVGVTLSF